MVTELAASVVLGCLVYLPGLCLKDDVHINGAHMYPEIIRIVEVARETAPAMVKETVWITSAADGAHMSGSLHFVNRAYDIRISNIVGIDDFPDAAKVWAERMQVALGDDYDVVLEEDHIHVEYDPEEK